jgi:hypothetical protein
MKIPKRTSTGPVSESEIVSALVAAGCLDEVLLSRDIGPYGITTPTMVCRDLIQVIEEMHEIHPKEETEMKPTDLLPEDNVETGPSSATLEQQLSNLRHVANQLGYFDAADAIGQWCSNLPELRYGCHCDIEPDKEPDACVISDVDGSIGGHCIYAIPGMRKEQCQHWRVVQNS